MGLLAQLDVDRLDLSGSRSQEVHLGGAFEGQPQNARFLDGRRGDQQAVMGQHQGALVAQRARDEFALFIAHRHARPLRDEGDVVVEHAVVHVRNLEGHFEHAERRGVEGMGMDDAVHIGARAIHP